MKNCALRDLLKGNTEYIFITLMRGLVLKDKVCFITRMKVEALFVPKYLSVPLLINMIFAYY